MAEPWHSMTRINLVASVALSVPLAFEVLEPDGMRRPPRGRDESILSRFVLVRTVVVAALMATGACLLFLWEYDRILGAPATPPGLRGHTLALAEAQTICVTTVTAFQACYLFNCRSLLRSVFAIGFFRNPAVFVGVGVLLLLQCAFMYVPALQRAFGTAPLDLWAWTDALLVGCVVFPAVFIEKRLRR